MNDAVRDRHPPPAINAVLNPSLRTILRSPAGRMTKGLAVLEFTGRRSGSEYRVVVGWHEVDGRHIVVTPARWSANFREGWPVAVRNAGRTRSLTGTLIIDPDQVTAIVARLLENGTSPRALGMRIPEGHVISPADITALNRSMILFD